jgi:hypothetical protein
MSVVTQIQLRRGTAAQWTSANPTLGAGEFGYETDTGKAKIGNGSTAWNSLSYSITGATGDVTLAGVQTLTNKTMSGASNTFSSIANASLTNSAITINGTAVSLGGSVVIEASSFVPSFMLGGM